MTVLEIIKEWLTDFGYDGLWRDDEDGCGCRLDDLAPCLDRRNNMGLVNPSLCKAWRAQFDSDPLLVGPEREAGR